VRVCFFTLFLLAFWGNTNIFPASRTLGGLAERPNVGKSSHAVRETASSVYHIIEGTVYTEISGGKFSSKKGDTFRVPA
jgi:gentisate 1,2-dioxygenase